MQNFSKFSKCQTKLQQDRFYWVMLSNQKKKVLSPLALNHSKKQGCGCSKFWPAYFHFNCTHCQYSQSKATLARYAWKTSPFNLGVATYVWFLGGDFTELWKEDFRMTHPTSDELCEEMGALGATATSRLGEPVVADKCIMWHAVLQNVVFKSSRSILWTNTHH